MTAAQDNWVFLGSNTSLSGETGISVPRGLTGPPRSPSLPYYDLLMVRWSIKSTSSDTLYFFHDLNALGTNYDTRIWRYASGSVTPSETNSAGAGFMRLTQNATTDTLMGFMLINNIPRPSTGQRGIEATIINRPAVGTTPTIQIASGSTIYDSPMKVLSIGTVGANALSVGSTMSVFGCNII
tara:strand:+ start:275 stop:823 length:549 start_codon:yes stop_codon:yes gene_type:complete